MFTVERVGANGAPSLDSIRAALNDWEANGPALNYLARMLSDDDSRSVDELFDSLLQGTLQVVQDQDPVRQAEVRHHF